MADDDRTAPPDDDLFAGRGMELTDPRAIRAYAHPVRLRLLGLLRRHGPMTATQAAARLGESSGTASFHLRQLAKYGFCEEAGGGKGREKPWRATALFTSWSTSPDDPERTEAEGALNTVVLQLYVDQISRWFADRADDPPEWQKAAGFGDLSVPMTPGELEKLRHDVEALVRPYLPRVTGEAEPPDGARSVKLLHFEFPDPDERS
jgi:DNA-binding transcriptional ArsR family regulator